MSRSEKVWIMPPDGIADGETVQRFVPLIGLFAVKFGRGKLERALSVQLSAGHWRVHLDGIEVAPPDIAWRNAFGHLYRADSAQILTGRKLTAKQYAEMVNSRRTDVRNGTDLSAKQDLNELSPPSF